MRTEIGKIKTCSFGFGGYQDAMFGATFDLGSEKESWGVGDFWGDWEKRTKHAEYSENDFNTGCMKTRSRIISLMRSARVTQFEDLQGKPVEVTFNGNMLESWRILEEVL